MTKKVNKPTKVELVELCQAHTQLEQAMQDHEKNSEASKLLKEMFEQKTRQLESQITNTLKQFLML